MECDAKTAGPAVMTVITKAMIIVRLISVRRLKLLDQKKGPINAASVTVKLGSFG